MRSKMCVCGAALVLLACVAGTVDAGVVPIVTDTVGNLVGGNPVTVTDLLWCDVSDGNMKAEISSRAYSGDNGLYAYLYQVDNTGLPGNSSVEMFTLWPFTGADDDTDMGYLSDLSGVEVGDFYNSGGYVPEDMGYVDVLTSGAEVSFYYTKRFGYEIPAGNHSKVLYVMSELSPDEILGNVINGSVGSGPVVGPVPEPTTLLNIALGSLAALALAMYRRRSPLS